MKKKAVIKTLLSIFAGIGAIMIGVVLIQILAVSGIFFLFYPPPPPPAITYGEFDFELVYEIGGERITVRDTIICEYDGFKSRGAAGPIRMWKATLKSSGKEELTLLDLRSSNVKNELNQTVLELQFHYGSAAYYMGEGPTYTYSTEAQSLDYVSYMCLTQKGTIAYKEYEPEEAFEKYQIRLISWKCDSPIENTFEKYHIRLIDSLLKMIK